MNTIHLRANQGLVMHKALFTYVVHSKEDCSS